MSDSDQPTNRSVRAHVLGVPRRDGEILVERYDRGEPPFYRPIGGGIEFGEHSHEAIVREFHEETGYEIEPRELLGISENVFEFAGTPGHELTLVWAVAFVADEPHETEQLTVTEDSNGSVRTATWHTPAELRAADEPCYPEGVLDLLGDTDRVVSK